jgi:preprotein translocase subunit SecE
LFVKCAQIVTIYVHTTWPESRQLCTSLIQVVTIFWIDVHIALIYVETRIVR